LNSHAYSPAALLRIVEAAGELKSFAVAARLLQRLADIHISARHVGTLTAEIGQELQQARDQRTDNYIHHRRPARQGPAPSAVAVAVDGGRVMTRTPGQGPGVHGHGWKEDKVACLHVLDGPTFASDPHPEVPRCFQDAQQVGDLVRDLQAHRNLAPVPEPAGRAAATPDPAAAPPAAAADPAAAAPETAPPAATEVQVFVGRPLRVTVAELDQLRHVPAVVPLDEALAQLRQSAPAAPPAPATPVGPDATPVPLDAETPAPATAPAATPTGAVAAATPAEGRQPVRGGRRKPPRPAWPPRRKDRTCVATMSASDAFGKHVASEASARQFDAAPRRAFLGDGLKYNWTIHRKWFKDYEPITDFIHPLAYLYRAATAVATTAAERWRYFQTWLRSCWQGRVAEVLTELRGWQTRLGGVAGEKRPDSDPRAVLQTTVTYLQNNAARMDYPRYRQLGLPVTSAAVESLIKEFNYRVKGTEKFWNQPAGAERILQVRAAVLSDDGRLAAHVRSRPGSPYRYRQRCQSGKIKQAA
jgi:hypothetical protein